jgi:tellurite resistance protein TehA-like permease
VDFEAQHPGGGIQPYSPALAVILFTAGAAFAFGFAVWRTGGLWQGEREHAATTAVLYLPTVAGSFGRVQRPGVQRRRLEPCFNPTPLFG